MKLGKGARARRKRKEIMQEIDIMKVCKHENVIDFIEYFSTKDRLSLILEFLGGKNLLERLLDQDGFSEPQAHGFFVQMANAVHYLHEIDIVHRNNHIMFNSLPCMPRKMRRKVHENHNL